MLRSLAHLGKLLALFAAFGALTWAAFAVISTSNEVGTHQPGELPGLRTAAAVFVGALLAYAGCARLAKEPR